MIGGDPGKHPVSFQNVVGATGGTTALSFGVRKYVLMGHIFNKY
jgi:hypothetical protein